MENAGEKKERRRGVGRKEGEGKQQHPFLYINSSDPFFSLFLISIINTIYKFILKTTELIIIIIISTRRKKFSTFSKGFSRFPPTQSLSFPLLSLPSSSIQVYLSVIIQRIRNFLSRRKMREKVQLENYFYLH